MKNQLDSVLQANFKQESVGGLRELLTWYTDDQTKD